MVQIVHVDDLHVDDLRAHVSEVVKTLDDLGRSASRRVSFEILDRPSDLLRATGHLISV